MKKILLSIIAGIVLMVAVPTPTTNAINAFKDVCNVKGAGNSAVCQDASNTDKNSIFTDAQTIINTLLFVSGMVAVVVIIIGAIKYVTSAGDQSQVSSAKNTIIYAVIGLVVVSMAYAIVQFVLKSIK